MDDDQKMDVPDEMRVNEATVELLRRRIEADVKKGFFTSIGAPVGGAGIIAILYVLFSWIPGQLGRIIENTPGIHNTIQVSVLDYLGNENKGQKFIREQVDASSRRFISESVTDYMASDTLRHFLQGEIAATTHDFYREGEGFELVRELVEGSMASNNVQRQIRDAVNNALAPMLGSLSRDVEQSFNSVVYELPELAGTEQINKESLGRLYEFLASDEATDIEKTGTPVVLTIAISRGHYDEGVMREYITRLSDRFSDQFGGVAILGRNGEFISLVSPARFETAVREDRLLIGVLNGDSEDPKGYFRDTFGEVGQRWIGTNAVVRDVLVSGPLWESLSQEDLVAVVGNDGELRGVTSRRKIIAGCLNSIG